MHTLAAEGNIDQVQLRQTQTELHSIESDTDRP